MVRLKLTSGSLKDDPNSADFVIKSGNREFRVHSHVVALHSDASHSVLKPGFSVRIATDHRLRTY